MVLHNDKWHKKASRNYRRKHGIPPPNRRKTSDDESEESQDSDTHETLDLNDSEIEDQGSNGGTKDTTTTSSLPDSGVKDVEIVTGSGTLVEQVDKTLTESGVDVSAFRSKRSNKKKLGNNDWRYHDEDDLEAALARDPTLKYDPEFQEKLRLKQEEDVFEAEQLRNAREATKKKFQADKERYEQERDEVEELKKHNVLKEKEGEEEEETSSDEEDYNFTERKVMSLQDLEDDSDDDEDFSNIKGVLKKKKRNVNAPTQEEFSLYGKKSHMKKLDDDELLKYREIQRNIDQAEFESSVKTRFGKQTSSVGATSSNSFLNSFNGGLKIKDKQATNKALVIGNDGKAKMVTTQAGNNGSQKSATKQTVYGDVGKSNGVFESKGVQNIDDFFDSLDGDDGMNSNNIGVSNAPTQSNNAKNTADQGKEKAKNEEEEEEEEEEDDDDDSDSENDFSNFKARLAQKNSKTGKAGLVPALDFLNI